MWHQLSCHGDVRELSCVVMWYSWQTTLWAAVSDQAGTVICPMCRGLAVAMSCSAGAWLAVGTAH
jgi:hypothetical protein